MLVPAVGRKGFGLKEGFCENENLPETMLARGLRLEEDLRAFKSQNPVPDYGWYPYQSLASLPVVSRLLGHVPEEALCGPIADLGCGDGEWSVLLAQTGAEVDAIDHRESNFNQMRGADLLRRALAPAVALHDLDLDRYFSLPRRDYGLILFLGTLYHLKNPYHVLETLASAGDWCVLSTRIARLAPHTGARIEDEPMAYLLDRREANNDPTNFWIFTAAGLRRLAERTGWMVIASEHLGCTTDSDPVRADRDERIFMLLRSRTRHPELWVRPLGGWHEIENGWRWTARVFAIEVVLPPAPTAEFALRFTIPEVVIAAGAPVVMTCRCEGALAGSISCDQAETIEFRGRFPENTPPGSVLRLEFEVESAFAPAGDERELGVIVPVIEAANLHGIPFRVS